MDPEVCMAAPVKQQISTDVFRVSGSSENHVKTSVDEDGEIQVAHALLSTMKEETLEILQKVEKSYRCNLGSRHSFTRDVQRRINSLRARADVNTRPNPLTRCFNAFTSSLRTGGAVDEEDEEDEQNPKTLSDVYSEV